MLRNAQQPDGTGHIIISALGQGRGIIMSRKDNILIHLSRHIQHHILGGSHILLLFQDNFSALNPFFNQGDGILDIDVDTRDDFAVAYIAAQLPGINVPVGIIHMTVIGHKANSTVFQQILINPIAKVTVNQNDFPLALMQRPSVIGTQIIEGSFHGTASGAHITLAGNADTIGQKCGLLDISQRDIKWLKRCFQAKLSHLLPQIFRCFLFLRSSAHTDVGRVGENFHYIFCIHRYSSFLVSLSYHIFAGTQPQKGCLAAAGSLSLLIS